MSGPVSREILLKPSEIEIGERLRPLTEAGVESLIASIAEIGFIKDPIHVRALKGGRHRLIAGAHRLEAARRLNWHMVTCRVWSGTGVTDDWCRLMEVDDNLAGAEMDALDTAVFLAERKRLFLKRHPETAAGVAGAVARWDANDIESFASATAAKFGLSRRHVERLVKAGEAVLGEDADRLRNAPARPRLNDLLALAKADPAQRSAAIDAFASGAVRRIGVALRAPAAAPKDPVEEAFKALRLAWERAPEPARRRFVGEFYAALSVRTREEAERRIIGGKLGVAPEGPTVERVQARLGPRAGRAAS
jgi:ParB family chromosome partitioning protein